MPKKTTAERPRPRPAILRPLGAQLRRLRVERRLSQESVAKKAGLNYKYIGRIELAKADPGADVLVRLARALGVSVGEIFATITPVESNQYRLSSEDVDAISSALATVKAIADRIVTPHAHAGQARPRRRKR